MLRICSEGINGVHGPRSEWGCRVRWRRVKLKPVTKVPIKYYSISRHILSTVIRTEFDSVRSKAEPSCDNSSPAILDLAFLVGAKRVKSIFLPRLGLKSITARNRTRENLLRKTLSSSSARPLRMESSSELFIRLSTHKRIERSWSIAHEMADRNSYTL